MPTQHAQEIIDKIKNILTTHISQSPTTSDPYDPRTVDNSDYTTFRPISSLAIKEQEDEEEGEYEKETPEEVPEEEVPEEQEETPEEVPEEEVPEEGAEGDMGMGGMGSFGEEEEPIDPEELGKTFELKKIYTRLISIESFLSSSSDTRLLKLRNYVSQAVELFELLAANRKSFEENIDEIIVMFYKFLNIVYAVLDKYHKEKQDEEEEE